MYDAELRVAVIGGGVSGLSAVYELTQRAIEQQRPLSALRQPGLATILAYAEVLAAGRRAKASSCFVLSTSA